MKKLTLFISLALATLMFSSASMSQAKEKITKAAVASQSQSIPVDLNTADAEIIAERLKGIGLKKAKAIVDYRNKNGKFKTLEDLKAVKGIGDATINKNKELMKL